MKRWIIGVISIVAIIGLGVLAAPLLMKRSVDVTGFPPLVYPGFQTWPTPRDFDGPGTLLRLDGATLEYVGTLSVAPRLAGDETFGEIRTTGRWRGSVLADSLKLSNVSLITRSATDLIVNLELAGGQRWRVEPDDVVARLEAMDASRKSGEIFVVMEAISITRIKYFVDTGVAISADAKARLAHSTSAETRTHVEVSESDNGRLIIDENYARPHYLFYRASKVTRLQGLDTPEVVLVSQDEGLNWRVEIPPGRS